MATSPAGQPNAICPRCGSRSRHRNLLLYLREGVLSHPERTRVIHFAPEPFVADWLGSLALAEYLTVDLMDPAAVLQADVTDLPLASESFDVAIMSHVLEHVEDDAKALLELFRVLSAGGVALLQHPIHADSPTYEDPSITSRPGRLRAFSQEDHVRVYGNDFSYRLARAGFEWERVRYGEQLPQERAERFCLADPDPTFKGSDIYRCTRPPVS
jgi:SAM-dependent methyltransferase